MAMIFLMPFLEREVLNTPVSTEFFTFSHKSHVNIVNKLHRLNFLMLENPYVHARVYY